MAGADPSPPALTLNAALAEAFARSPALQVIQAEVDSAAGEVITAQTAAPPELVISPNLRRLNESDGARHEFLGSLALTRTFVFPGKRQLLVSLAQRNVDLRRLSTAALRFQLSAAVRKTFHELGAAQRIAGLRREQLESARTFLAAASHRAAAGAASELEVVKAEGDVINARRLLGAAEGDRTAASVELSLLLGREAAAAITLAAEPDRPAPERPLPELVTLALAHHPALQVQAVQSDIARLGLRKAELARKPDLTFGPSVEVSRSEQIIGVSATISLPGRHYGRGEILTAAAEQRRLAAEAEKLRREIAADVARAATQLANARQQVALYSPDYLARLEAVVRQAERSYAENATSLLLFLDARRTDFDALADYYDAIGRVATSRAALESAVGVSLDDSIQP